MVAMKLEIYVHLRLPYLTSFQEIISRLQDNFFCVHIEVEKTEKNW